MCPLTEQDLKFSLILLFRSTSSTASGCNREWYIFGVGSGLNRMKLSLVVAFPRATPIYPFEGESHDLMIKVLKHSEVAPSGLVALRSSPNALASFSFSNHVSRA